MPQCTACNHKEQQRLNVELIAGTPMRELQKAFGVSKSSLSRHKNKRKDYKTAFSGMREHRGYMETIGRISGELSPVPGQRANQPLFAFNGPVSIDFGGAQFNQVKLEPTNESQAMIGLRAESDRNGAVHE